MQIFAVSEVLGDLYYNCNTNSETETEAANLKFLYGNL